MARSYTLKKRADQQAETRRRIVEAAVDLHGSVGPAQTTLSMIAERAGVQRNTLYAHFPDERSLFMACSGLVMERDALPVTESWKLINDIDQRLKTGLSELYGWYERNAAVTAAVLRDAESHALTQEIFAFRSEPFFAACRAVLGETLSARQLAMLELALSFHTWRTLVKEQHLTSPAAAETMAGAISTIEF